VESRQELSEVIDPEVRRALGTKVDALEAEAAQLRGVLPSKSATVLADELHELLFRAADTGQELATLAAPCPALGQLKTGLAEAFVSLTVAAREIGPFWQDEGEAIGYQGASGVDCGYNKAIDHGYSFAFREPASGRTATVNVEAAAGAALSEETAYLALWRYRKDPELPARIVLGTDGGFRRS
jgi:hypothetical protein